MDSSQFPDFRGLEIPIGQELVISGRRQDGYDPGAYFGEQRQPTSNLQIRDISRYYDGTMNAEASYLNVGKYHEHAETVRSAAKIVAFTVKKFQNGFHEHWGPGQFLWALNKISLFQLSNAEFPHVQAPYPSASGMVGLTSLQLTAVLFEAEKKRVDIYLKEVAPLGGGGQVLAQGNDFEPTKPISSLFHMPEEEWSDPNGIKAQEPGKSEKVAVIKRAYELLPCIGWCNKFFIQDHLRLLGIIEHIQNSTEYGRVDVSVAVCGGSHTLNYWGPYLENGDRTMFTINKTNPERFDPKEMNPFRVIAYRNPMAYVPGIPITESGKSRMTNYDRINYLYKYTMTVGAPPTLLQGASSSGAGGGGQQVEFVSETPALTFHAGYVSRRDPVDYIGLADSDAAMAYAKECSDLLGPNTLKGSQPNDPAYSFTLTDSTARVVYLHVATF